MWVNTNGTLFGFADDRSGNTVSATSTGTVNDGKWHHVAAAYNRDGNLQLYIDGRADGSASMSSVGNIDSTGNLSIGYDDYDNLYFFNGSIDGIRIFDYLRTPAQVAYDYNKGAPVGYWDFDECQGATAYDLSGNNNHGTITIGATDEDTLGTRTTSSTAWVYPRSYPATADENDIFTLSGTVMKFAVLEGATDTGWFIVYNTGGGDSSVGSTSTIPLNQWTHIVGTFDSTGFKMYVNGKLDGTGAAISGVVHDQTNPTFTIGKGTASNYYWDGQIDDVKIWNYALTAIQVKNEYNNGAVFFGPSSGPP